MLDTLQAQLALRSHALDLVVCTTGAITMSTNAATYERGTGSFLTDGFAVGMEVTASGFTPDGNNGTAVITALSATEMTVDRTLAVSAADSGRTLRVLLPSRRVWENLEPETEPEEGAPYVEEQFVPGPVRVLTLGPFAEVETRPLYSLNVYVPAGRGIGAAARYATAIQQHFAPRTAITLSGGDVLRVRSDTGPFVGQLRQAKPGFAVVPVTVPLRVETANTI